MIEIPISRQVNLRRLYDEISSIPDAMNPNGVIAPDGNVRSTALFSFIQSSDTGYVTVHVDDDMPQSVIDTITAAIEAHDATPDPPPVVYSGEQVMTARVTTTGTTPRELFRATLRPLTAYTASVEWVGVDSGSGAMRSVRATIAAKRLNNGAMMVGTPSVLSNHADAAAAIWAFTPSVSGNDFVISVVGAVGRTVDWFCRLGIDSFTPGGQED